MFHRMCLLMLLAFFVGRACILSSARTLNVLDYLLILILFSAVPGVVTKIIKTGCAPTRLLRKDRGMITHRRPAPAAPAAAPAATDRAQVLPQAPPAPAPAPAPAQEPRDAAS
jgi:hypothetical protein